MCIRDRSKTDFIREAREASQVPLLAGDSSSATSERGSSSLGARTREETGEARRAQSREREKKAAREAKERKAAREA